MTCTDWTRGEVIGLFDACGGTYTAEMVLCGHVPYVEAAVTRRHWLRRHVESERVEGDDDPMPTYGPWQQRWASWVGAAEDIECAWSEELWEWIVYHREQGPGRFPVTWCEEVTP